MDNDLYNSVVETFNFLADDIEPFREDQSVDGCFHVIPTKLMEY